MPQHQPRQQMPAEKERCSTVRANMERASISFGDLAKHYHVSKTAITFALTGRYSTERTDTWLTQFEFYLSKQLGVRYIQPYFNDLD
ncbi:hypothetical protein [Weissella viridescens]|uniref:hypothetical protein n=1 Tax=Weissella viridescens TaxID=1629 RepID=UPI003AF2E2BE